MNIVLLLLSPTYIDLRKLYLPRYYW